MFIVYDICEAVEVQATISRTIEVENVTN